MTTKLEREYREKLREILKPGDTVYTVLRHVSPSGMTRWIDAYSFEDDQASNKRWLSYWIAKAGIESFDSRRDSIKAVGCGMDMGFHIVNSLGYALFPDGFECVGERCPSNDHSNGDRDYSPHHHSAGGYALRHEWI